MLYSTTNTYSLKREILSFKKKISRNLPKPDKKFIAHMNYGIIASGSYLLTDIVDPLHEPSKKAILLTAFPDIWQKVFPRMR